MDAQMDPVCANEGKAELHVLIASSCAFRICFNDFKISAEETVTGALEQIHCDELRLIL
jgi:hypothetical protein